MLNYWLVKFLKKVNDNKQKKENIFGKIMNFEWNKASAIKAFGAKLVVIIAGEAAIDSYQYH